MINPSSHRGDRLDGGWLESPAVLAWPCPEVVGPCALLWLIRDFLLLPDAVSLFSSGSRDVIGSPFMSFELGASLTVGGTSWLLLVSDGAGPDWTGLFSAYAKENCGISPLSPLWGCVLVLVISGNNSRFDDWQATQVQPLELYGVRASKLQLVHAKLDSLSRWIYSRTCQLLAFFRLIINTSYSSFRFCWEESHNTEHDSADL